MCGDIDICLKKINHKSICIVGLSRTGKSTLFNNINNIELIGDVPEDSILFNDYHYKIHLPNTEAEAAQAKSGY
jgi:ABC-type phosphate/phosphonate transport system ATPase subunit